MQSSMAVSTVITFKLFLPELYPSREHRMISLMQAEVEELWERQNANFASCSTWSLNHDAVKVGFGMQIQSLAALVS